MSLKFNTAAAKKADAISVIKETGKYVGTITRAEKLKSEKGTLGVGFSFKTDDGATANYLDIYTTSADGKELWGANLVQAILCCTRVNDAEEGDITFEKWTKDQGIMQTKAVGYPSLMNKRIGLILQRELGTNPNTNTDTDKVVIVGVFEASSGLTSSEIIDKKTKPERADQKLRALLPVNDRRKKAAGGTVRPMGTETVPDWVDSDIDNLKF